MLIPHPKTLQFGQILRVQAPCYNETMKYGDPDKLWNKVDRSGGSDACWPWTGYRTAKGYGRLYFRGRDRPDYAHRIAWELHNEIPPGAGFVCHHCDNPPCCNPAHLFLGSNSTNIKDALGKGVLIGARGERHPSAKLNEEKVRLIRQRFPIRGRWNGGSTRDERQAMANELGVSLTAIQNVIYGQTWKHIK